MKKIYEFSITLNSRCRSEMIPISQEIERNLALFGEVSGILYLFVAHTTAGITVNEGADADVVKDILNFLDRSIPWKANYAHREGNSAAHIKASFMGSSLNLFVNKGKLQLGTWQEVFFCEFDGPRNHRKVWCRFFPHEE
ncbi:MAG: YjbQ family protein [Planctomycetota bacterium]|nr:MAG: YjbQ family protein [Planctomycetota bacterium]